MFDDDDYDSNVDVVEETDIVDIESAEATLDPEQEPKRDRSKMLYAFYSCYVIFCVLYIITCGCGLFVATFGMNLALFSCFGKECVVLVD